MTVRLPSPRALALPLGLAVLLAALLLPPADDARGQGARPEAKKEEGAPKEGKDKVVADGLRWLALHQAADGRWSLHQFHRAARTEPFPGGRTVVCNCLGEVSRRSDAAATAFALLPFLGAGHTHRPGPAKPDYSKAVNAGLRYLLGRQNREGHFDSDVYANALATLVVCEAHALTADPKLKGPAQRAVDYIVKAQDPAGGGWRYTPGQAGDLSVTGYCLATLRGARMAGLNVPKPVFAHADKFVGSCAAADAGRYTYQPGGPTTPTLTAVGNLCRLYQGANPRNPGVLAGVALLKRAGPGSRKDLYYDYHASLLMHHVGGDNWESWNGGADGIRAQLLKKQDDGSALGHDHQKGSWFTEGEQYSKMGGRLMYTALALLILELEDSRLPVFRKDLPAAKKE